MSRVCRSTREREPTQLPDSFGKQLSRAFATSGHLCVGIDPNAELLDSWGLEDSAQGLESFSRSVLESVIDRVGVIKPQIAFFERFGSAGFAVLEKLIAEAREAGLLVIADAKRGDIGSTMQGYLEAWLGRNSSMLSSAVTVSPFLGLNSITDNLTQYLERGKGIFALVATSNPEGASVQEARIGDHTLSEDLFKQVESINRITSEVGALGSVGVVIGATLTAKRLAFLTDSSNTTPILAPGFGTQGARLEDVRRIFGNSATSVLASVSRSIVEGGAHQVSDAVDRANEQLRVGLDG